MKLYQLTIWSPFDGPIKKGLYRNQCNAKLDGIKKVNKGAVFIETQYPGEDIAPYEYVIEEIETED